jgi:sigma-B regulation protein RsbU (phosphoserine phosphatase)
MSVSERLRLAALSELDIMGSDPEERFDRVTRIAKELFKVPIAEINFIDRDTQFTKSPQAAGGSVPIPRSDSFCDVAIQQPDILVVPNALGDPRFSERSSVTGTSHVRFYAGRPLSVADGVRVGTICIVDTVPRELDPEEAELLDELGLWVERELSDARPVDRGAQVQRHMLPGPLRHGAGFSFAGFSRPHQNVSGDYFSWNPADDHVDVTIADVMGKGVPAAIIASAVRSAFQARTEAGPAEAVAAVNAQMIDDFSATGTFVTLFHARADTATGEIRFADAGHGLTLVIRHDGTHHRLATRDLPLGISGDTTWETHSLSLDPGDVLFSCTDGVLDLLDGSLDALHFVASMVRDHPGDDAFFEALSALVQNSAPEDDVTAILIRSLTHTKEAVNV